ncbi:hypothetical protein Pmar_PMAR016868 [Perkinsus marinus ATCC 50983]|uniref:Aminoglycoside phosphotransferase domain-containing protein n=1 Tax=Perkinsus marinus (strain ATCC 50983 / TXsc) TaxID=423536 RepID=C5LX85_PERM5|nr:hypothetical protein Pmar_PMAR016868 [Perkinsus marinus ATCC 50983]EEQ98634.1 hypothetical protein Pmar_PMAR016868 [Perkinsus marinus ATCC 50983]|eukprot:XP_002765917.1 hypothetical protein Pmar_PMAR016868 [Perkinsus marinus ATCC 50983]
MRLVCDWLAALREAASSWEVYVKLVYIKYWVVIKLDLLRIQFERKILLRPSTEPVVKALRSCGMRPAADDSALSGGYVGAVRKVKIEASQSDGHPDSVVVKSIPETFGARMFAGMFGSAQREARFYVEIASTLPVPIPKVYLSKWSRARGSELIIMQNIGNGLLAEELKKCKDPHKLVEESFKVAARFHAEYWGATPSTLTQTLLGQYSWLKNWDYVQGQHEAMFTYYKGKVAGMWSKVKKAISTGKAGDRNYTAKWEKRLVVFIDNAIEYSTWEAYQKSLREHKHPLTLVHGDYHAGNQLWDAEAKKLYTVDWPEASVGEGPADIAQFIVSNVKTDDRRKWEEELIHVYWDELGRHGVDHSSYTLAMCREAYVRGGIDRWVQLLILMAVCGVDYPHILPDSFMQYFIDQVNDFIVDHKDEYEEPYILATTYDAPW